MYKALKDNKIIAISDQKEKIIIIDDNEVVVQLTPEEHFPCLVYDEIKQDKKHSCDDFEQYNGEYLLKKNVPVDYQNEKIRQQRQARYEQESDPLRLDYDEALARGEESAEQLKQDWLASKDKIREELPYVEGSNAT